MRESDPSFTQMIKRVSIFLPEDEENLGFFECVMCYENHPVGLKAPCSHRFCVTCTYRNFDKRCKVCNKNEFPGYGINPGRGQGSTPNPGRPSFDPAGSDQSKKVIL